MIYILLILFLVKHHLADFEWQTPYMLRKFLPGKEYILPLAAHCLVHSALTFLISISFTRKLELSLYLSIFDFTIHFIMDRIKASPKLLGRYKALSAKEYPSSTDEQKANNVNFWKSLSFDQTVHHATHYVIIYFILRG